MNFFTRFWIYFFLFNIADAIYMHDNNSLQDYILHIKLMVVICLFAATTSSAGEWINQWRKKKK